MSNNKPWWQDTPIYDVWTTDRSNFTPLGLVILYMPWFLLALVNTIIMGVMFVGLLILLGPVIALIGLGEAADKKYHINDWLASNLCKTSQWLKLLKRC